MTERCENASPSTPMFSLREAAGLEIRGVLRERTEVLDVGEVIDLLCGGSQSTS